MKALLGVLGFLSVAQSNSTDHDATISLMPISPEYLRYCARFGKAYQTIEEFKYRAAIFEKTSLEIEKSNLREDVTYRLGHNKFSDMTRKEYLRMLNSKPLLPFHNSIFEAPESDEA